MEISHEAKMYWSWIVQAEYKRLLETYTHIEDEAQKIELESHTVKVLNEYNLFFLGRTFAAQIELNKSVKKCGNLPNPYERYPHLFKK